MVSLLYGEGRWRHGAGMGTDPCSRLGRLVRVIVARFIASPEARMPLGFSLSRSSIGTRCMSLDSYPRGTARGIDLLALVGLWCVSIAVVNPMGDFPLNDDWSFGLAARHLAETGDFRPTGWTSMPLLFHTVWGALFCIPTGFSFDALRFSTLTLGLVGMLAMYWLVLLLQASRGVAMVAALCLAFNPIYHALSHTYMTDIPFTALVVVSALFYGRGLIEDSRRDVLIATTLALLATLNRQLGIALPLAYGISTLLVHGLTTRRALGAGVPFLLCVGALGVFQFWLGATGRLPAHYSMGSDRLHEALTGSIVATAVLTVKYSYAALLYLGCFAFPVLLLFTERIGHFLRSRLTTSVVLVAGGTLFSALAAILWLKGERMPIMGNIVNATGIGPFTLRDTYILETTQLAALPGAFLMLITLLSLIGGTCLLLLSGVAVLRVLPTLWPGKTPRESGLRIFLFLCAAIYLAPLLLAGFMDRYLVPVLPFVVASIACLPAIGEGHRSPFLSRATAVLMVLLVLITTCGTRDYLNWNRARWDGLTTLTDTMGVSPDQIDGGFEFNGLMQYDPEFEGLIWENSQLVSLTVKSWWWVKDDTYTMAFGEIPGYQRIAMFPYRQCLPPRTGSIFLLEKVQE